MIELEPETMTAAPRTRANFAENGQMSEPGKTSRRQPNPPEADFKMYPTGDKPAETPESVFSAAVRSINKRFQLGTLEYIENHAHELAEDIRRALDRLDLIWSRWIPGADLQPFKRALRTYYNLIIRAVDIFEGATNGKKAEKS